jgi:hypothetical protein
MNYEVVIINKNNLLTPEYWLLTPEYWLLTPEY